MTKNNVVWKDDEDWGYSAPFNISVKCPICSSTFDVENNTRYIHNDLIETKKYYHHLRSCPYCDSLYFSDKLKRIKLISELNWYEKIIRKLL